MTGALGVLHDVDGAAIRELPDGLGGVREEGRLRPEQRSYQGSAAR